MTNNINESKTEEFCCSTMSFPIEECSRQDIASFQTKDYGARIWCSCCGRFWVGTDEEIALAHEHNEDF